MAKFWEKKANSARNGAAPNSKPAASVRAVNRPALDRIASGKEAPIIVIRANGRKRSKNFIFEKAELNKLRLDHPFKTAF
jgi:hypothetical protein